MEEEIYKIEQIFEMSNEDVVDLLNQQYTEIKRLNQELIRVKNNGIGVFQNQKYTTDTFKTLYYKLKQENQQLKQQLENEEQSHDLCIQDFEEETDKLRKQIKFESDARKRLVEEVKLLKQSQNQFIIGVLEKLKSLLEKESKKNPIVYDISNDLVGGAIDRDTCFYIINNYLKEYKKK